MKIYKLKRIQRLAIGLDEAWSFFSNPANLRVITPPELDFRITSELPERIFTGAIITYKVRPLMGIPVSWVTEIKHVVEGKQFVDEQRFGPYALWHHRHEFTEIDGGIEMLDEVHYGLPFDPFGRIAHGAIVKPKLQQIFDYRWKVLEDRFGVPGSRGKGNLHAV